MPKCWHLKRFFFGVVFWLLCKNITIYKLYTKTYFIFHQISFLGSCLSPYPTSKNIWNKQKGWKWLQKMFQNSFPACAAPESWLKNTTVLYQNFLLKMFFDSPYFLTMCHPSKGHSLLCWVARTPAILKMLFMNC